MSDRSERSGVGAVDVAGTILQAMLALGKPSRLRDLELATEIPAAKLHRYLVSLIRCGLVRRHEERGRYDFGLLAYQIGQASAHGSDIVSMLAPVLQDFSFQIGEAVGLARWLGQGATIDRWFQSDREIEITSRPGTQMSLTSSATGKLFAAYLPRDFTEPLVRSELMRTGEVTKARMDAIYVEFERIRKMRMASAIGTYAKGFNALSVPIFDNQGKIFAAITVLGTAATFDADFASPIAKALADLGRRLSTQMGYRD